MKNVAPDGSNSEEVQTPFRGPFCFLEAKFSHEHFSILTGAFLHLCWAPYHLEIRIVASPA